MKLSNWIIILASALGSAAAFFFLFSWKMAPAQNPEEVKGRKIYNIASMYSSTELWEVKTAGTECIIAVHFMTDGGGPRAVVPSNATMSCK